MTTSNSSNFIENRNEIILAALGQLGIYGIGKTVSAEDMSFCVSALNRMVKYWITHGLHLWCKEEGTLFLDQYVASYSLGNASSDAKVALTSDSFVTQLDGAAAISATALTVDDTSNMSVSDNIGIVLTDKSIHWTTIATIPTSATLTINSGLASAASDNGVVYTFTSRLYKPLRIHSARLVTGIDSGTTSTVSETLLNSIAYQTYFDMPSKTTNGVPTQFHYNPNNLNGQLYIWPRPSDTSYRIEFSYERTIQDLDEATDNFDFPVEWLDPLIWQLAIRLAPHWGKEDKANKLIVPLASEMLKQLKAWDSEMGSIYMIPSKGN